MKKEFIGFYTPTEKEISNAWSKGTFAFDANTLLNLYRYSENTRKDFLSALNTIHQKLFLPHQAALEFHTNRIGVIESIGQSYDNLYKIFESNYEKNIESQINQFKKHPVISIESINKLHRDFLKKLSTELEKQKKLHPDFKSKDEVLGKLTELFEYSTGKEFTKEELKKIYSEGKDRYAECIPPGYKDLENKKKKGDRHIYGDLIIWKELISRTKKEKKPIILVTDDRKEDWWTIENGKTIRPREELIKEFFDLTGIRILIYNADNFLHFAKEKRLVPKIKEATINEVKQIRLSDENLNEYVLKNFGGTSGLSVHDYINSGVLVSDSLTNFGMPIFKNYSNLGTTGTFLKEPYSTVLSDSQLGAIVPNTGTVISSSRIPFSAKLFNTETTLKKESENNNDNTSKNKETK